MASEAARHGLKVGLQVIALAGALLSLSCSGSSGGRPASGTFESCSISGSARFLGYRRRDSPLRRGKLDVLGASCVASWTTSEDGRRIYTIQSFDESGKPGSLAVFTSHRSLEKLRYGSVDIDPVDYHQPTGFAGVTRVDDDHVALTTVIRVVRLPGEDVPFDLDEEWVAWEGWSAP